MSVMKRWVFASVAASGLMAAAPAVAADAVALVMSVSGKVSPSIAAYSEIPSQSAIDLGSDGRISFVHYPSCRQVTVLGGKLTFGAQDVEVDGGTVEKETPQKCPKKMSIKVAGTAAAVRTRDIFSVPTPRLSERPSCVLLGGMARDFKEARVTPESGGKALATMKMSGPVFQWPAKAMSLADGRYKLQLIRAGGGDPWEMVFAAGVDGLGEGECQLKPE